MRHLIWFLILPPVLAYWLWQGVGYKERNTKVSSNTSFGLNGQRVRLGRHGYWILLAICYAASSVLAFALREI
jgi:hypothetical protein